MFAPRSPTSRDAVGPAGRGMIPEDEATGRFEVAHPKDKGQKQVKKVAQKNVKEKRAAKRAKKEGGRPQHLSTTNE